MTEPPPRYRTLDRPGFGLATIAEPTGRVALWTLVRRGSKTRRCAGCGTTVTRYYRPSLYRGKGEPRLCRPCVEDTAT